MSSGNKEESSSSQPEIIEDENSEEVEDSKAVDESSMDSGIKGNKTDVKKGNKEDSDAEENDKSSDAEEIKKDNDVSEVGKDSDIEIIESEDEGVKNGRIKGKTNTKKEDKSEKADSDKESDKVESDKESEKGNTEKGESEKESEDEEGDKEMALLDRPVEVSGCRARKKVERLDNSFSIAKEKQGIPEGKGQKLGEIPIIEFQISKRPVAELKLLHRILFARPGSVYETKKNIRKFSGYLFQKGSGEYEQKKTNMEKFKIADLKKVCEVLHLERGGTREDIILRILDFLLLPKDSGKAVPKKKSAGRARKTTAEKKTKNSKKKSKIQVSDEADDEIAPSASEGSDNTAGEESDYESKKSKSTSKGKKTTVSKAKSAKKEKTKKESVKGTKRKRDIPSDSSGEDDEPVAKKSKMPTDDEIKKLVKKILDKADLQEITMKKVIKQVFDTYPECDLAHKKAFIKSTIKSVIA